MCGVCKVHHFPHQVLSDDFMANKTALAVYKAATSAIPGTLLPP